MMGANCQIFTPKKYVKKLLKSVNYVSNIYGKSFLENSCGEGSILIEAVKNYIKDCKKQKISNDKIKIGLERDIQAFEVDKEKIKICIENLDKICRKYSIFNVNWNIKNEDALKYRYNKKYDYIIGNPPYISYRDLEKDIRFFLKENFNSCEKGKFDYCYAFIESSINNLDKNGRMAYLVPNSIFKNVFGIRLRNILKPVLMEIHDNFPEKVFNNAIVSPSIIVIDNGKKDNKIIYYNETTKHSYEIDKNTLEEKWIFSSNNNIKKQCCAIFFSKNYIISNSIATLSNESFVIKKWEDHKNYIKVGDYMIEKELVKCAVSPSSMSKGEIYRIIFPYYYINNNLHRYSEAELKKRFPEGYKYLNSKKEKLNKRDSDKGANWFEYGRSQALRNMNSKKLMISIMVTRDIKVFEVDENTIPYSGIYILPKNNSVTLAYAKKILESKAFKNYCFHIGIASSGKTKRITCNDVKNYIIEEGGFYE